MSDMSEKWFTSKAVSINEGSRVESRLGPPPASIFSCQLEAGSIDITQLLRPRRWEL